MPGKTVLEQGLLPKLTLGATISACLVAVIDAFLTSTIGHTLFTNITVIWLGPITIFLGLVVKILKDRLYQEMVKGANDAKIADIKKKTLFLNIFVWVVVVFATLVGMFQIFIGVTGMMAGVSTPYFLTSEIAPPGLIFAHCVFLILIVVFSARSYSLDSKAVNKAVTERMNSSSNGGGSMSSVAHTEKVKVTVPV